MKKILIIEDNTDILENIAEILELSHYKVTTAVNGKQGLEKALQDPPDLILCDIMMPELDGYGVLHAVQQNPTLDHIPFLFLTAKAEKEDWRHGMSLGADDYIIKPFDPTDLLSAIERRLRKAEKLQRRLPAGLRGVDALVSIVGGDKALTDFVSGRHVDAYKKKQRIYNEGNRPQRVYFVKKGSIKVYRINDEGKELIVRIAGEGEFFGYAPLLEETVYRENAEALEDAEVVGLPRTELETLMHVNREVQHRFIRLLASDVADREDQLIRIAYNSLRKKVADALLRVHRQNGDGAIRLSRENMAAMAGTATESLIRTLSDFRSENLIEISAGSITILDEDKLEQMLN